MDSHPTYKCSRCGIDHTPGLDPIYKDERKLFNMCWHCNKFRRDSYDNHVDPLRQHRNPDRIATHD